MKMARTERSTDPDERTTRRTRRFLDCSYLRQCSEKIAAKPHATADMIRTMTAKVKKMSEPPLQSPEAESRPLIHYNSDAFLSGKLSPGRIKPSMATDDVSRFWVLNSPHVACFCKLQADKSSDHVALFVRAFRIREMTGGDIFLPKKSVLFLQRLVQVYVIAATVIAENSI